MITSCRISLLCLICGIGWLAQVQAQYPTRPIRFILPFPPGGGTDTMGRAIGTRLGEALGQQIIIDNHGGGGANIGAELAAKSPPDGYTLFMMTGTHTVNVTLYRNLGYNLVRDFAPVSRLGGSTGMVPNSSSPEELGRHMHDEIANWAKVVKALDLRAD